MSQENSYNDENFFKDDMVDTIKVIEALPWDEGDFVLVPSDLSEKFPDDMPFEKFATKGDAMGKLFDLDRIGWMILKLEVNFADHVVVVVVEDAKLVQEACAED